MSSHVKCDVIRCPTWPTRTSAIRGIIFGLSLEQVYCPIVFNCHPHFCTALSLLAVALTLSSAVSGVYIWLYRSLLGPTSESSSKDNRLVNFIKKNMKLRTWGGGGLQSDLQMCNSCKQAKVDLTVHPM